RSPVPGRFAVPLLVGGWLAGLTVRGRERDSAIGAFLAFGLGLGVLWIFLYRGYATVATGLLFGSIVGVDNGQVVVLAVVAVLAVAVLTVTFWPLVFASVDPEAAEARGVS